MIRFIILFILVTPCSYAQNKDQKNKKDSEKTYSQAEFDQEVKKQVKSEVEATLNRISAKNIVNLAKELLEREEKIKKEERQLELRNDQLKIAEKKLQQKISDFDLKQKKVLGCIDENDKKALARVRNLVQVISNMRPAKAAEVLSVQETDISVQILSEIDSKKASRIFNLMDKEISARLQKQYLNMKR